MNKIDKGTAEDEQLVEIYEDFQIRLETSQFYYNRKINTCKDENMKKDFKKQKRKKSIYFYSKFAQIIINEFFKCNLICEVTDYMIILNFENNKIIYCINEAKDESIKDFLEFILANIKFDN